MKFNFAVQMNLRTSEAAEEVKQAAEKALKDVIVDIANYAIKKSPHITGNNRRSIAYGVGRERHREGTPVAGKEFSDLELAPGALKGMVYSTSGYGGFLETGTRKMPAQPYFKPALDKHIGKLPAGMKAELK